MEDITNKPSEQRFAVNGDGQVTTAYKKTVSNQMQCQKCGGWFDYLLGEGDWQACEKDYVEPPTAPQNGTSAVNTTNATPQSFNRPLDDFNESVRPLNGGSGVHVFRNHEDAGSGGNQ